VAVNNLGLPDAVLESVVEVLDKHPSITSAKVFGSRAKGTNKQYSDVDIAIFVTDGTKLAPVIKDELEELDTIYTFDVLDYHQTQNPKIKAHIDRVGVEILHFEAPLMSGKSQVK